MSSIDDAARRAEKMVQVDAALQLQGAKLSEAIKDGAIRAAREIADADETGPHTAEWLAELVGHLEGDDESATGALLLVLLGYSLGLMTPPQVEVVLSVGAAICHVAGDGDGGGIIVS